MAKAWYVIRVASNREERVRDNLLVAVRSKGMEESGRCTAFVTAHKARLAAMAAHKYFAGIQRFPIDCK